MSSQYISFFVAKLDLSKQLTKCVLYSFFVFNTCFEKLVLNFVLFEIWKVEAKLRHKKLRHWNPPLLEIPKNRYLSILDELDYYANVSISDRNANASKLTLLCLKSRFMVLNKFFIWKYWGIQKFSIFRIF